MMKNPFDKNKIPKILGLTVTMFAVLLVSGGTALAWGPDRCPEGCEYPTYTNEIPANYATFNSITNNVAVGDERNFVRVRELGTDSTYADEIEVTPGKEYEVYIYYHNNAASNTNATGYGMATDVRVASAYPTILSAGERGMISGIISWSYVTPESPDDPQEGRVWDEAYLTTQANGVVMRYKTGTATIHNAGRANGSVLSTNLFTEGGTYIGFNTLGGNLPGCAEYSGYITYTLVAENIDSELEKQVSLDGENWADEVTARPGDYVTYRVRFTNTGNTNLTNVIFKDTHDEGLSLRAGSTKVFDVDHVDGLTIDDIIDLSGYNTGDSAAGSLKQVIYQSQVAWDNNLCNKSLNNTISVAYNSADQKTDDATVLVACEEEPVPDEPEPEQPTCITNPELPGCQRIVNTGPVEITLAVVILAGIGGTAFYLVRTRRVLSHVEKSVTGTENSAKIKDLGAEEDETSEKIDQDVQADTKENTKNDETK